jgi:hypothetical protein
MLDNELLGLIMQIVYDVPDGLYKYPKPGKRYKDEYWSKLSPSEKGFILIKELVENNDINNFLVNNKDDDTENINILKLGKGPTFLNSVDEKVFFKLIYSLASYKKIEGDGTDLYLYYKDDLSLEEKKFLNGLFQRYGMEVPIELKV